MAHILVVDDEERIREVIKKYAQWEGYEVTESVSGEEAVELCKEKEYDLIVMDVMMPGMDGFLACKEIKEYRDIPVLMLSARGEEYDRIHGFEVGVDDYVVKPFSPRELMLRIKVILGRKQNGKIKEIFQKQGFILNFSSREVFIDGRKVNMTNKEYELLCCLVKNKGIALTREKLLSEVWGYNYCGDDRTLDTHIKLLRNSLGEYRELLVTLRGVGYRFEA
ncbi:MAG: response regulator transcription factor [Lachnospiraceae bacterium]|nr:response regulator transcription factor [Lachnospiraceae bacterium]